MGPLAIAVVLLLAGADVETLAQGEHLLFDASDDRATYDAAMRKFDAVIAAGDAPAVAWARKAETSLRLGDLATTAPAKLALYEKGQAFADDGIARDARCGDCWFWRGANLGRFGETRGVLNSLFGLNDVRNAFAKALEIDPKNDDAVLSLAIVDQKVPGFAGGDIKRAESTMRRVLKASPGFTRAMLDLAELLWERGENDEARRWAQKAIDEKNPLHAGSRRKFDLKRARSLLAAWQ